MTTLRRRALASVPMTPEKVESLYLNASLAHQPGQLLGFITGLCESHERLQAEAEGAEVIINDYDAEVKSLRRALKSLCEYAAASRESNTKEFMQELADHMNAAAVALKEPTAFVWHHDLATGELWFTTRSIP